MTNEELLEQISHGDETTLAKLCLMNTGLVKDRARLIARRYYCLQQTKHGGLSDYAKEMLSELESVGKLTLVECIRAGAMMQRKADSRLMLFHFWTEPCGVTWNAERSMGTLALDCDSMGLVRKAQRLYYQEGKEPSEICASLGIPFRAAARAITYPTHFFSVYNLQRADDDIDIFDRLASTRLSGSAEDAVIRMVTMECLREEFLRLSKKDQDILGRYFGVYAFPKTDLQEIAMRNLLKESGVEKAKDQALKRLQDRCQDSFARNSVKSGGWCRRRNRHHLNPSCILHGGTRNSFLLLLFSVAQFLLSCLSVNCTIFVRQYDILNNKRDVVHRRSSFLRTFSNAGSSIFGASKPGIISSPSTSSVSRSLYSTLPLRVSFSSNVRVWRPTC